MTIKEVMDKTTTFFKQKVFHSPRLDAELLIAHGLNFQRMQLYLKYDQTLNNEEVEKLRELVKRRTTGEPVAYIVGKKDFYKGSFVVNKSVLIPRPETESLVELAAQYIEREKPFESFQVLDIGGGSGCIGISLAKEYPEIHVSIIEKSKEAAEVIKENIFLNQVKNVSVFDLDASDITDFKRSFASETIQSVNSEQKTTKTIEPLFDLIVSNPPYIALNDPHLAQGDLRFEPVGALTDGADGLTALRQIITGAPQHLIIGGWLWLEHGYEQGEEVAHLLLKAGFNAVQTKQDLAGLPRITGGSL
jgi:release factor glutamine methyltransferase